MFNYLNSATVRNLRISGSVTGAAGIVGALAGQASNTTIEYVGSDVDVDGGGSNHSVGGLVGYLDYSLIRDSYSRGSVTSSVSYTGGLVGSLVDSRVEKSYATGSVNGPGHVGGLVGVTRILVLSQIASPPVLLLAVQILGVLWGQIMATCSLLIITLIPTVLARVIVPMVHIVEPVLLRTSVG